MIRSGRTAWACPQLLQNTRRIQSSFFVFFPVLRSMLECPYFDEIFIRFSLHNSEFFLIIVVYLGGLIVEYREGMQETAYGIGIHLLGHEPASDLWSSSWEMRGRTNCGRGCSFSFFIGYDKTL